jgi:hypothetical protein
VVLTWLCESMHVCIYVHKYAYVCMYVCAKIHPAFGKYSYSHVYRGYGDGGQNHVWPAEDQGISGYTRT